MLSIPTGEDTTSVVKSTIFLASLLQIMAQLDELSYRMNMLIGTMSKPIYIVEKEEAGKHEFSRDGEKAENFNTKDGRRSTQVIIFQKHGYHPKLVVVLQNKINF